MHLDDPIGGGFFQRRIVQAGNQFRTFIIIQPGDGLGHNAAKYSVGKCQHLLTRTEIVIHIHPQWHISCGGVVCGGGKLLEENLRAALAEGVDALFDIADDE